MNKKLGLFIIIGLLASLLIVAGMAYDYFAGGAAPGGLTVVTPTTSPTGETQESTAQLATDFTVYDLEGNPHKLSDFRGKPVVLNFWASWCTPCQSEMPDFEKVYAEMGGDIHFLMVNLTDGDRETVESASTFIAEKGYTFPVYYDTDVDAAMAYWVTAVPVTYFIDAEGYLIVYGRGMMDEATLLEGIGMITQ